MSNSGRCLSEAGQRCNVARPGHHFLPTVTSLKVMFDIGYAFMTRRRVVLPRGAALRFCGQVGQLPHPFSGNQHSVPVNRRHLDTHPLEVRFPGVIAPGAFLEGDDNEIQRKTKIASPETVFQRVYLAL